MFYFYFVVWLFVKRVSMSYRDDFCSFVCKFCFVLYCLNVCVVFDDDDVFICVFFCFFCVFLCDVCVVFFLLCFVLCVLWCVVVVVCVNEC